MNNPVMYWGIIAGILLIFEVISPALISIWFSISAFVVMFLTFIIPNVKIQILIFFILSLTLLFSTKKILKHVLKSETNFDSSKIGEKVRVIKKVEPNQYDVKYKGVIWSAYSTDELENDTYATIKSFNGNKIIIEKGDEND